jgi:hypothetical protein
VDAAAATLDVPSFEVTPIQVMAFKKNRYAGSSYFDIGSGLLPFSITPSDATSTQTRAMLAVDRVRADAFDLGGDPESGEVAPGEVARLCNLSGYIPQTWNEALSQILGMQALMGAILGHLNPVVTAYKQFKQRYRRMLPRLELEIDHVHGRRLGPAIMTFHVQLAWRNWMVLQLDTGETDVVTPLDFGVGLTMLETQNNLMWIPLRHERTSAAQPQSSPAARHRTRSRDRAGSGWQSSTQDSCRSSSRSSARPGPRPGTPDLEHRLSSRVYGQHTVFAKY